MNVPIKTHSAREKYIIGIPEWNPRYKSLISMATKGIKYAISRLLIIAPENTAIPRIGVKFGGWGINLLRVNTPIIPSPNNKVLFIFISDLITNYLEFVSKINI